MFDLLRLTLDEAWALRDYIRQHDKLGQEWDKDFMRRVHAAVLDAKANPVHDVSLLIQSEDELWQMDRQIPSQLMVGTKSVGRELLCKVMELLRKMDGGDDDEYPGTSEDAARNDARTTAPDAPGGSLPIST